MSKGRFGVHGGQYMPETLMNAVIELEEAYNHYKNDPAFNAELTELLNNYAGRPSRLYFAAMSNILPLMANSRNSFQKAPFFLSFAIVFLAFLRAFR